MRLESGLLWPVPVTLDVPDATAEGLCAADRLALQDPVMLSPGGSEVESGGCVGPGPRGRTGAG